MSIQYQNHMINECTFSPLKRLVYVVSCILKNYSVEPAYTTSPNNIGDPHLALRNQEDPIYLNHVGATPQAYMQMPTFQKIYRLRLSFDCPTHPVPRPNNDISFFSDFSIGQLFLDSSVQSIHGKNIIPALTRDIVAELREAQSCAVK